MPEKLYAGLTYEQIVRKYSQTVANVCLIRLQNYADAEDCFQNTFVKLFTNSPQFTGENHLKAWLIRVAVNGTVRLTYLRYIDKSGGRYNVTFYNSDGVVLKQGSVVVNTGRSHYI